MRVVQQKVQTQRYRTEYLNYSWSASLWNTICPSCHSAHGPQKPHHCWPPRASERTRRTGPSRPFGEGEKREGRRCDEQRMKNRRADKQTRAQCESLVFHRLKVPARSGATAAPASPSSLWASDPSSDARSALQFVSGEHKKKKKINTWTPKSQLQASTPAVSLSSRLFVSLFLPPIMFALCFSSPLFVSVFVCLSSLSLLRSLFSPFNLFFLFFSPLSHNPRVPLRLYSPPRFISGFRLF